MIDLVTALKDANIPTILVLIGAVAILLAMGVKGGIELDKANRRLAGWVGTLFLLTGMSLFVIPGTPVGNSVSTELRADASKSDTLSIQSTKQLSTSAPSPAQQRIEFNYGDEAVKHGWQISAAKLSQLSISLDSDFGTVLVMNSPNKREAYVEYTALIAKNGTNLEFLVMPDETFRFYVRASLKMQNSQSTKDVWLKLTPHQYATYTEPNRKLDDDEWEYFIESSSVTDGWQQYQINLNKLVEQSWKKEGYALSELSHFRLRGSSSLAYIAISK